MQSKQQRCIERAGKVLPAGGFGNFDPGIVKDYRDVTMGDASRAARFNAIMRQQGILKPDSKFYASLALTDDDITQKEEAIAATATALRP